MQDSDDPCDDVTTNNLTGWTKRDSTRGSEENTRQRLGGSGSDGHLNSWTRFEHG